MLCSSWCSLGARDKLEKLLDAAGECKKILVFSGSGLSAATGNGIADLAVWISCRCSGFCMSG